MAKRIAILVGILGLALSGCATHILARKIVQAPNTQGARKPEDPKRVALFNSAYSQVFSVAVGPPAAHLSVAVVEPGDYDLKYSLELIPNPRGGGRANYKISWDALAPGAPGVRPKATLVLLHGILVNKEFMVHWALYLAQKGYRTVLVDLRGHGKSTGDWITFGSVEREDLKQVLNELRRRGLASGPVGALGVSYGAVMALDWAAIDPRVASIVALEPFSDPRKAIVEFSRSYAAEQVVGITDAQFASAEAEAAQLAHFKWADADVLDSVRRLRVPVLFYHGGQDTWIPPAHSERLMAVAPPGSRLQILPDDNHITLSIRLDPIAQDVAAWFDAHLPAAPAHAGSRN